jgi:hypothetical protein
MPTFAARSCGSFHRTRKAVSSPGRDPLIANSSTLIWELLAHRAVVPPPPSSLPEEIRLRALLLVRRRAIPDARSSCNRRRAIRGLIPRPRSRRTCSAGNCGPRESGSAERGHADARTKVKACHRRFDRSASASRRSVSTTRFAWCQARRLVASRYSSGQCATLITGRTSSPWTTPSIPAQSRY